jgi:hypothetical protein
MRAILIDPEKKTVTEIQLKSGDYREIRAILQCHSIASSAHLGGSIAKGFDAVFVSDDLLEEREDPRFWFQVDASRDPPSSFPIAGRGVAMGTDSKGDACDVRIGVAELASWITFTQRKFRGFKLSSKSSADVTHLSIDVVAPIVDNK